MYPLFSNKKEQLLELRNFGYLTKEEIPYSLDSKSRTTQNITYLDIKTKYMEMMNFLYVILQDLWCLKNIRDKNKIIKNLQKK